MTLKKTRVLKSCLFALTLLSIGGLSTPSHARHAGKPSAAKQQKVKVAKAQRRQLRKSQPQKKIANLRLKSSKAQARSARVATAVRTGNLSVLMTKIKGMPTLKPGKFNKADRAAIYEALNTVKGTIKLDFAGLEVWERAMAAQSIFMNASHRAGGYDFLENTKHPMALIAWVTATESPSMIVSSNHAIFHSPNNVVEFKDTPAGVIKTSNSNGWVTRERAFHNPETHRLETKIISD